MTRHLFAWSGALLFALALGSFAFAYMVPFAAVAAGPARAGDIAWNVGLFTVFAFHHSLFARAPIREAMARLVPVGLERSCYVWVASLLLVVVCILWRPVGGVAWVVSGPWRALLWTLQGAGAWLTLHGAAVIDVSELSGASGARPTRPFKVSGPYGWVRHPIYAGWFLLVFAVSPMTMTRLVLALTSSVYLLVAIPLEERSLRGSSGGAYDEYIRQVPWKLLPGVFGLCLLVAR